MLLQSNWAWSKIWGSRWNFADNMSRKVIMLVYSKMADFSRIFPVFQFRPPFWPKNITSAQTFYVLMCGVIPLSNAENRMNLSERTRKISKNIAGGLLEAPSPLGRPRKQNRLGRASVKPILRNEATVSESTTVCHLASLQHYLTFVFCVLPNRLS